MEEKDIKFYLKVEEILKEIKELIRQNVKLTEITKKKIYLKPRIF